MAFDDVTEVDIESVDTDDPAAVIEAAGEMFVNPSDAAAMLASGFVASDINPCGMVGLYRPPTSSFESLTNELPTAKPDACNIFNTASAEATPVLPTAAPKIDTLGM